MIRWLAARLTTLVPLKVGLTAGLTALFAAGWLAIPRWLAGAPHTLPVTRVEARLPFVEPFVYLYLSIILFMPLAPYLMISGSSLRRHGIGFATLTLFAFACFVAYPVETPVPVGAGQTAALALLLRDTRLNSLPSLHAAYVVYALLAWEHVLPAIPARGARRATGLVVSAWAGLILVSILLTKQHYLVDVIAGAIVAVLAYAQAFRGRPGALTLGHFSLHPSPETNR